MKDPFEAAACGEQHESPPESPIPADEDAPLSAGAGVIDDEEADAPSQPPAPAPLNQQQQQQAGTGSAKGKEEEVDGEEEEENININVEAKLSSGADPDKLSKMQAILSQFTEEQMSRYESFRRSGFQKSNMRRLLTNITGSQKISMPMTIVVSGIAKMFVGELVETGRAIMMERKETGPIRPCHIREAYRRLKLEGKIPRRSVPRLLR